MAAFRIVMRPNAASVLREKTFDQFSMRTKRFVGFTIATPFRVSRSKMKRPTATIKRLPRWSTGHGPARTPCVHYTASGFLSHPVFGERRL